MRERTGKGHSKHVEWNVIIIGKVHGMMEGGMGQCKEKQTKCYPDVGG